MTTRIRDFGKINYLVDRKVGDTNWEGFGKRTHTDARKAVYKEILEGFRSLQEAEEYIKDQPEGNVIFTARGDEITFSMLQVVIGHIKKNKWYSPWFRIPEHRVPMTSKKPKDRRTAFYIIFWKPKSDPEISQPYNWDGPEAAGAYASLDAALRSTSELEEEEPQAFDIRVYSREERYEPDEDWPDLYGYWETIDGTEKDYDERGRIIWESNSSMPMTSKGESRFERSRRMKAYWRTKEGQARAKHLGRYFEDSWTRCERCGGFLDAQGICKKCVRS